MSAGTTIGTARADFYRDGWRMGGARFMRRSPPQSNDSGQTMRGPPVKGRTPPELDQRVVVVSDFWDCAFAPGGDPSVEEATGAWRAGERGPMPDTTPGDVDGC